MPSRQTLPLDPDGDLYVFAYGSLMWRPGFTPASTHPALLRGFHRRFCLWSHRYRGTPEAPGLVLGLDRGGACRGLAFRVPGAEAPEVLAYLDNRELPDGAETVYHRRLVPVRLLDSGRSVRAVAYVANRQCRLYCGRLAPEEAAAAIARGHGQMGPNREYLLNTVAHLRALGVRDAGLDRIAALVWPDEAPQGAGPAAARRLPCGAPERADLAEAMPPPAPLR
ncbi:gamma-glutamylcyclotransferase [Caldovatus aquaticus]|uniref:glutathione-specific gamma-glutamylcyclotransferase n=1 Tax=Caldovatus aquaticus TaxID=2865671 RepID=A0ABS7F5A0_9PROT|nr:gamma-glutamylcyclotransferase [Caldovatus aquaticus]MBW8270127.1 gamma-glutamylcyclotransferase [Caldovatus aquaticus]